MRYGHRELYFHLDRRFQIGARTFEYDGLWTVFQLGWVRITYGR